MMYFFTSVKKHFPLFLLPFFIFFSKEAVASHAMAADLTYVCLGGNQYQITLAFYRDCDGVSAPTSASINISGTPCGFNSNFSLPQQSVIEVSPVCPALLGSTNCNGGTDPGIEQYIYQSVVTLPAGCNFTISYDICCRNSSITNLQNPGSEELYIATTLDTSLPSCNNSPVYSSLPVEYICTGQAFSYNHGAIDPDGDSLSYRLIDPQNATPTIIPHVGPFSSIYPLTTASGAFNFSPITGQMTFTPVGAQFVVISVLVEEWRNGVLIGSSIRELQVVVLNCTTVSSPPGFEPGNVIGGFAPDSVTFEVCAGAVLSLDFGFIDPDDTETITVVSNNATAIPGSIFTQTQVSSDSVFANFTWNTIGATPGNYSFIVSIEDDACPINNSNILSYTIVISELEAIADEYFVCTGQTNVIQLEATGLGGVSAPGSYTWSPTTGLDNPNIANPVATITGPITYTVTYVDGICSQMSTVELTAPYNIEFPSANDTTICDGGNAVFDLSIPENPPLSFTSNVATTIPTMSTTDIPLNVSGVVPVNLLGTSISSVCFDLDLNPASFATAILIAPNGSTVELTSGNGFFAVAGYENSCFSPSATDNITNYQFATAIPPNSTFAAEGNWNNLNGPANGTWVLRIIHNGSVSMGGTDGSLNTWTINFSALTNSYDWTPTTGLSCTNCPDPTITTSATTTYTVTAVNDFGCRDTTMVTVFVDAAIPIPVISCAQVTGSSITFSWPLIGGVDSYLVSINAGAFTNVGLTNTFTVSGLASGTTVTIDVQALAIPTSGCADSGIGNQSCTTVVCPTISPNITGPLSLCGTQSIVLTSAPYDSYLWSNGETTQSITVSSGGVYSVTAADINLCTGIDMVTVTGFPAASATITPDGSTSLCGSETVNLDAGAGYASYDWSNGETTQIVNVNSTNNYTVIVTDVNGCTAVANQLVTSTPGPVFTITADTSFCMGDSTTVDAGGAFDSYLWSNGEVSQSFVTYTPGVYTVTITESGCSSIDSIEIQVADPITTITGTLSICTGEMTTLDAGGPFDSYLWGPNGETTQTITTGASGTYSVTVTQGDGCTSTDAVTVNVAANVTPIISTSGPTTFCAGGSVDLDAGTYATYIWAPNGETTQTITTSTTGTYSVTVTTASGCTGTSSISVTNNPLPVSTITPNGPTTFCDGGSVDLDAGVFSSYSWAPNGETTQSISASTSGLYIVTITDISGCTASSSVSVTVNSNPVLSITGTTDICMGNSTTFDAGPGFTTYQWSNSNSTQTINTSTAGVYSVTVSNLAGCTAVASTTLTVNSNPTPGITGNNNICAGENTTFDAGSFATYIWSPNGETTQTITSSASGTYAVTVTDANGCTGSDQITLTVNPNPTPTIVNSGPLIFCDGGSVDLDAGAGYTTYLWNTGAGTQLLSGVNTSGVYSVTVTDANGCTGTDGVTVTVNPNPTPTITGDINLCFGTTSTLDAGSYTSYIWAPNGETTQTVIVSASGMQSVTVTDTNGCTGSASVMVTVDAQIIPTITGDNDFCAGESTTLDVGAGFTTYAWSDGTFNQTTTVTTGGMYNVTVTDTNGCTGTDMMSITEYPAASTTIAASGSTTFCIGGSVDLDAGTFTSYLWSPNGETAQMISVTTSGTYSVVVTDANGCTASDVVTVTVNPLPTPSIVGTNVICIGETTTFDAGAYTSYIWAPNGETTQTISTNTAGNYSVTVTNANGCTGTDVISLTVNPNPVPAIVPSGPTTFCDGGSVDLDAGSFDSYLWNTGMTTQVLPVTTTGVYSVTVTDINGCTGIDAVTVTVNPNPTPTITGDLDICFGEITNLDAGSGYSSYLWAPNGETSPTINASATGNYSVTVTDANGCSGTTNVNVTVNPLPTPTITTPATTICLGFSTNLDAGSYLSYIWAPNGETTQSISTNGGGVYTVTVTDVNGCTGTDDISITELTQLIPTITPNGPTTFCDGGSVNLDAGSYSTYLWAPNGETSQTISATANGTYSVTVTDILGCTGTQSISITVNPNPTPVITGNSTFCFGTSTMIDAGIGYSSYAWSTGATSQSLTLFDSGTFTVTVTDMNGCSGSTSITVTEDAPLVLSESITNVSCFSGADGSITVAAAGGAGSYSFAWSNGGNTGTISGLAAGNYTTTVTDISGCSIIETYTVNEPAAPVTITPSTTNASCNGFANGEVVANASGGTPPYTYLWSNGQTTDIALNLVAGSHSVTVTDANSCAESTVITITEPSLIVPIVSINNQVSCFSGNDGSAAAFASGGVPPYTYLWDDGTTGNLNASLTAGAHTVDVTDANGCVVTGNVTLTEPTEIMLTTSSTPASCIAGNDGTATVSVSGGTPPYTYLWDAAAGNQITPIAGALITGFYSVIVTDSEGCTATITAEVEQPNILEVELEQDEEILCKGDATGGINSIVTGGTAPYTYLWSTSTTLDNIDSLIAGIYSVTVTDVGGCTATSAITIEEPLEALNMTLIENSASCNGSSDGSIQVIATGGTTPYEYSLDGINYQTGDLFDGLTSGSYDVSLIDAGGCELNASITVGEPVSIQLMVSQDTTIEIGNSVTLLATTNINPLMDTVIYNWSPSDSLSCTDCANPVVIPGESETYMVTVTNASGCQEIGSVTVNIVRPRRLYIANTFTPNGDGMNDVFLVQGGVGVKTIRTFYVYDRWGEKVYSARDIEPNNLDSGWDGTFKGQKANPGVFGYYVEVEYIDGFIEKVAGDVTLLR